MDLYTPPLWEIHVLIYAGGGLKIQVPLGICAGCNGLIASKLAPTMDLCTPPLWEIHVLIYAGGGLKIQVPLGDLCRL
jgi:hypothetical protein